MNTVQDTVANLKGIPTRNELIKLLQKEIVEVTFTKLKSMTDLTQPLLTRVTPLTDVGVAMAPGVRRKEAGIRIDCVKIR